jgi:hypothetical protein
MKTAQYQWSRSDGWTPNLRDLTVEQHGIVFVFGARPLIQAGEPVSELRAHFKGHRYPGLFDVRRDRR